MHQHSSPFMFPSFLFCNGLCYNATVVLGNATYVNRGRNLQMPYSHIHPLYARRPRRIIWRTFIKTTERTMLMKQATMTARTVDGSAERDKHEVILCFDLDSYRCSHWQFKHWPKHETHKKRQKWQKRDIDRASAPNALGRYPSSNMVGQKPSSV